MRRSTVLRLYLQLVFLDLPDTYLRLEANVLKLFTTVIYDVPDKLESLYPANLSSIIQCLWVWQEASPRGEFLNLEH
jgi:hypothetical protein